MHFNYHGIHGYSIYICGCGSAWHLLKLSIVPRACISEGLKQPWFLVVPRCCKERLFLSLCDIVCPSGCLSMAGPPPPMWFLGISGNFKQLLFLEKKIQNLFSPKIFFTQPLMLANTCCSTTKVTVHRRATDQMACVQWSKQNWKHQKWWRGNKWSVPDHRWLVCQNLHKLQMAKYDERHWQPGTVQIWIKEHTGACCYKTSCFSCMITPNMELNSLSTDSSSSKFCEEQSLFA